jgi:hypothetical protein
MSGAAAGWLAGWLAGGLAGWRAGWLAAAACGRPGRVGQRQRRRWRLRAQPALVKVPAFSGAMPPARQIAASSSASMVRMPGLRCMPCGGGGGRVCVGALLVRLATAGGPKRQAAAAQLTE